MKKLLFVILTLLAIAPANAQDKKHNFAVSFETSDYSYREPSIPYPPHWTGTMYGVSAKYTGRGLFSESQEEISSDRSFWSLELRYMQGDTDYDGFLQNGTPFKGSDIGDYYIEGAITAGAVYDITQSGLSLWPYLGLGARHLVDHLNDMGPSGYRRESTYIYLPLGFNIKQDLSKGWSLSANGQLICFFPENRLPKACPVLTYTMTKKKATALEEASNWKSDFQNLGYSWNLS